MEAYAKGTRVIHIRTQREETVVGLCRMKVGGEWIEGVVYEGADAKTGRQTLFVKAKEDFDKEFIYADWYGN